MHWARHDARRILLTSPVTSPMDLRPMVVIIIAASDQTSVYKPKLSATFLSTFNDFYGEGRFLPGRT